jgi:hypothetical protein
MLGGEIATSALVERTRGLLGPEVVVTDAYSSTEMTPVSGVVCSHRHLHFNPLNGLVETKAISGEDAVTGFATVVVTPFPPLRECNVVLRYDTGDVVRPIDASAVSCELRNLPATGMVMGKLRHGVRHAGGWTFTRDVLEALEWSDAVALPARYGFWSCGDGVGVEVVTRHVDAFTRAAIGQALEAGGVPLRQLHVTDSYEDLRQPRPLRLDLDVNRIVAAQAERLEYERTSA